MYFKFEKKRNSCTLVFYFFKCQSSIVMLLVCYNVGLCDDCVPFFYFVRYLSIVCPFSTRTNKRFPTQLRLPHVFFLFFSFVAHYHPLHHHPENKLHLMHLADFLREPLSPSQQSRWVCLRRVMVHWKTQFLGKIASICALDIIWILFVQSVWLFCTRICECVCVCTCVCSY